MGVLDWLYEDKKDIPSKSSEAKTGSVEKAAMQISERKKRMKRAECARRTMEYDPKTGDCV